MHYPTGKVRYARYLYRDAANRHSRPALTEAFHWNRECKAATSGKCLCHLCGDFHCDFEIGIKRLDVGPVEFELGIGHSEHPMCAREVSYAFSVHGKPRMLVWGQRPQLESGNFIPQNVSRTSEESSRHSV